MRKLLCRIGIHRWEYVGIISGMLYLIDSHKWICRDCGKVRWRDSMAVPHIPFPPPPPFPWEEEINILKIQIKHARFERDKFCWIAIKETRKKESVIKQVKRLAEVSRGRGRHVERLKLDLKEAHQRISCYEQKIIEKDIALDELTLKAEQLQNENELFEGDIGNAFKTFGSDVVVNLRETLKNQQMDVIRKHCETIVRLEDELAQARA